VFSFSEENGLSSHFSVSPNASPINSPVCSPVGSPVHSPSLLGASIADRYVAANQYNAEFIFTINCLTVFLRNLMCCM
jgi:hypothetical protein